MYKEQENQEFKEISDSEIEKYKPRKISDKQAEQEIIDYVKEHEKEDAFDIAVKLKLEPNKVSDICKRLVKKGKLEYLSS
jgi:DNA-binding MarR family transcriptional regulator